MNLLRQRAFGDTSENYGSFGAVTLDEILNERHVNCIGNVIVVPTGSFRNVYHSQIYMALERWYCRWTFGKQSL